tara:strand:- start:364 stop:609 length:246 start_codon:yes stop_codon:yes gene_type:complete
MKHFWNKKFTQEESIGHLDLHLKSKSNDKYMVEITENYEGDKFHLVVFDTDSLPHEHYATFGCETLHEAYSCLKLLQNDNI